jgi:hypothetical protein
MWVINGGKKLQSWYQLKKGRGFLKKGIGIFLQGTYFSGLYSKVLCDYANGMQCKALFGGTPTSPG